MKSPLSVGIRIVFAALVATNWSSDVATQPRRSNNPPTQSAVMNGNAPGVDFIIRTKNGQATFKQGELITIEMLFTSSLAQTYQLDARTYDRSGHLDADSYHVEPEVGTSEPLRDYLHNGMFGGSMGGIVPLPPPLRDKPYIVSQDLNEFVRFDQPGTYSLYVTNNRVSKLDRRERSGAAESYKSTSNKIEIEILPADAGWQKEQLEGVLRIIDADKQMDRRPACHALRFLNTEAAEIEMIRRYRGSTDGCDGEFHFGLISSPRRLSVVGRMESQLAEPDHPVTSSFVHTLITLIYLDRFSAPMASYSEVQGDKEKTEQWQAGMRIRREGFQQIAMEITDRLSAAISRKTQSARAVSIDTLLQFQANIPKEKRSASSITKMDQTASSLRSIFVELPAGTQYRLLTFSWKSIASPEMLPALRQLIEKPSRSDGTYNDLLATALFRLFEMAPDEGRIAILREMRHTPLRVRPGALGILPDETLPEFDDLLREKLASQTSEGQYEIVSQYADLIARYATGQSFRAVRNALGDRIGRDACMIETPLVAYILRVDPSLGAELLDKETPRSSRNETRCFHYELGTLSNIYMSKAIEQLAIKHLDDRDENVVMQAANVLSQHGTADDEAVLWEHLQQWHDEWVRRGAAQSQTTPKSERSARTRPAQVGEELIRAIARGRGWLMTEEKFKRLEQLGPTPQGLQEMSSLRRQAEERQISTSINYLDGTRYFQVAQYEFRSLADFKEKLAQFPKGTSFTTRPGSFNDPGDYRFLTELSSFLNQQGMKLTTPEPDK